MEFIAKTMRLCEGGEKTLGHTDRMEDQRNHHSLVVLPSESILMISSRKLLDLP